MLLYLVMPMFGQWNVYCAFSDWPVECVQRNRCLRVFLFVAWLKHMKHRIICIVCISISWRSIISSIISRSMLSYNFGDDRVIEQYYRTVLLLKTYNMSWFLA